MELSDNQQSVVDAPLESLSVIACAGSGKTETAVQRVAKIRDGMGADRSYVALLSFSNVAVDTFQRKYYEQPHSYASGEYSDRVLIDTFDGFITSNILRPHAYRTMGCSRTPFLIDGGENFLENNKFQYWYPSSQGGDIPFKGRDLKDVTIRISDSGEFEFCCRRNNQLHRSNNGDRVTRNLGSIGAYTHELGKYWALQTLLDQPEILRVLANRFRHIVVDEAQDLGEMHQYILQCFIGEGVKVSLIGDPNQAIYEFAGATGDYLRAYDEDTDNTSFDLDTNYRSISPILDIANSLSNRRDKTDKEPFNDRCGAYYVVYEPSKQQALLNEFSSIVRAAELNIDNSAVLCRGNSDVNKIKKDSVDVGRGKVKLLAQAAIARDVNKNYQKAYRLTSIVVAGLFKNIPESICSVLNDVNTASDIKALRLKLWEFVRCSEKGLPRSTLKASGDWHKLLKERFKELLDSIVDTCGYEMVDNIGNKLAKTGLPDSPLLPQSKDAVNAGVTIRVDTVHQAKGESLDAVLYMAQKKHIESMLDGVETEEGRIGYVAVTRAKYLFVLGVPKSSLNSLRPRLEKLGLQEIDLS